MAHTLLDWRTQFRFGLLEAGLLALYSAVLALTIPHHEPWVDEAQAWLIARDNSIWQILRYRLHYEGHPGLWHVLLHLFQQLGGRYGAIDYFGAAFAVAGIAVFLRYAPFPLILRILLPFTFFLQYQYAVIARSYTLFPLLTFGLCVLFYRKANPLWFALVAGLLANLSFQGAVESFVLLGLYFAHLLKQRREPSQLRSLALPALVYLGFFSVAALVAMPAPDTGIANGGPVAGGAVARLLAIYPGTLPRSEFLPPLAKPRHQEPPSGPFEPAKPIPSAPSALRHPALWAADFSNRDRFTPSGAPQPRTTAQVLLKTLIELATLATAPVSTIKLLALAFLATLVFWLHRAHALRMLLPWIVNIIVGEALWIADHHTGMLFLGLIAAIWLAAPQPGRPQPSQRVTYTLFGLLTAVALLQIGWSISTVRNDVYKPYDPGPATAAWLQEHPHKNMAAFGFVATGVQPYFNENPFFNLNRSYYLWAVGRNPEAYHYAVLEEQPGLVLYSQDLLAPGFTHNDWAPLSRDGIATQDHDLAWNPVLQDLARHGYVETHRFCGDRFFRNRSSYRACNLIFEPSSAVVAH